MYYPYWQSQKVGISILQVKKPSQQSLAASQGHTARMWMSWDLNQSVCNEAHVVSHRQQPGEAGRTGVQPSSHFIEEQAKSQSMSRSHTWSAAEPSLEPDPSKGTQDGAVTQRGHWNIEG